MMDPDFEQRVDHSKRWAEIQRIERAQRWVFGFVGFIVGLAVAQCVATGRAIYALQPECPPVVR